MLGGRGSAGGIDMDMGGSGSRKPYEIPYSRLSTGGASACDSCRFDLEALREPKRARELGGSGGCSNRPLELPEGSSSIAHVRCGGASEAPVIPAKNIDVRDFREMELLLACDTEATR